MNPKEHDDCLHALGQTFAYFGKELSETQIKFWKSWFQGKNAEKVLKALFDYITEGKYAPKIGDIAERYKALLTADKPMYQELPQNEVNRHSPENEKFWRWMIRQHGGIGESLFAGEPMTDDEIERAIQFCNAEARKYGRIEAIPEHLRIQL